MAVVCVEKMMEDFFSSSLESENIQYEKKIIALNTSKRRPIIVLLDISESMSNFENMLKRMVEGLYEVILKDRRARNAVELGILCFNGNVEIYEKLREIKCQERMGNDLFISCNGDSLIGMALKNAIVQLEIRKKLYEINRPRIKYYSPMIILISDGKPECNTGDLQIEEESLLFSKDYIAKAVAANRLVSITVEIGNDCNHNLMTELTGLSADKHVAKINNNSDLNIFLKNISYVVSYGTDIDFRNE